MVLLAGHTSEAQLLGLLAAYFTGAYLGKDAKYGALLHQMVLTLGSATLVYLLARHISLFWHLLNWISVSLSGVTGRILSGPLEVGPSLSGLWVVLLSMAFLAFRSRDRDNAKWLVPIFLALVTVLMLVLAVGLWLIIQNYPSWNLVPLLAGLFLLADATSSWAAKAINPLHFDQSQNIAIIDASHVPKPPLELFEDDATGGIYTALFREGFFPVVMRQHRSDYLENSNLLVYIAPAKPFSSSELADIHAHLHQGGTVLFSISAREYENVRGVLELAGIEMVNQPLGDIAIESEFGELQFVDAWPIRLSPEKNNTIYAQWQDYVVAAQTRVGQGRLIVVADPRFLSDENFEGEYEFNRANIRFFNAILDEVTGT